MAAMWSMQPLTFGMNPFWTPSLMMSYLLQCFSIFSFSTVCSTLPRMAVIAKGRKLSKDVTSPFSFRIKNAQNEKVVSVRRRE